MRSADVPEAYSATPTAAGGSDRRKAASIGPQSRSAAQRPRSVSVCDVSEEPSRWKARESHAMGSERTPCSMLNEKKSW
ncbi:hypothetical protein OHA69_27605 [Streptomyces anulatus]|uniref:hypothetical protein n=1 Tax=Streptomyces anulatus TaxID=1892 RepID=UPI002255DCD3|nr:hypothetical protein [Streptomyces anulatus]MCX4521411.1 hypothetical protein [Streptomyces anulatus]